jgi:hypothetical protein
VIATPSLDVPQIRREVLEPLARMKLDTGSDGAFYGAPRLVNHVDDDFLRQLTQLYRERLPQEGCVLDLMSSWVSHLPPEVSYSKVSRPGDPIHLVCRGSQRTHTLRSS